MAKVSEKKSRTQLLNSQELAKMLNLSKRQIFRLNSCGKIPAPIRIGGSVRWASSTIEEWVEMGCPDRSTFESRKETQK